MSLWIEIAVIGVLVLAAAAYSGSEAALYSLSRTRVELEARRGGRIARMVQKLLADDVALLIVLLIGNSLMIELMTYRVADFAEQRGFGGLATDALLALGLTPIVFFFAELFPKDLFRRRPHTLLRITAPFVLLSRYAFWPIERALRLVIGGVSRLLGLEPNLLSVVRGREVVLRLLRESAQSGALLPHAEQLAQNVLRLRSIQVNHAMIAWKDVTVASSAGSDADVRAGVARSRHTRLPVVDSAGRVQGYVHQLDVLGDPERRPVLEHLRPLLEMPATISVDRALARLRREGQRIALVGSAAAPLGLISLKDLVEEISGDLAGW